MDISTLKSEIRQWRVTRDAEGRGPRCCDAMLAGRWHVRAAGLSGGLGL